MPLAHSLALLRAPLCLSLRLGVGIAPRATPRHHASNRGLAPLDLVPLGLPDGGGRATTFCAAAAGASRKLRPLRRFVPGSCDSIRSTRVRSSPIECWISPSLVSTRSSCDLLPRPPLGGLGEDLEDEPREKKPRLLVLARLRAVERAIQRAEAERFTCQISTRSEVRGQRSEVRGQRSEVRGQKQAV